MQWDDRVMGTPEDGQCKGTTGGLHIWEADWCCMCGTTRDVEPPCNPDLVLTDESYAAVVDAIERPPEPTESLRELMRRHE